MKRFIFSVLVVVLMSSCDKCPEYWRIKVSTADGTVLYEDTGYYLKTNTSAVGFNGGAYVKVVVYDSLSGKRFFYVAGPDIFVICERKREEL